LRICRLKNESERKSANVGELIAEPEPEGISVITEAKLLEDGVTEAMGGLKIHQSCQLFLYIYYNKVL
jgi:hypothetical protein